MTSITEMFSINEGQSQVFSMSVTTENNSIKVIFKKRTEFLIKISELVQDTTQVVSVCRNILLIFLLILSH